MPQTDTGRTRWSRGGGSIGFLGLVALAVVGLLVSLQIHREETSAATVDTTGGSAAGAFTR